MNMQPTAWRPLSQMQMKHVAQHHLISGGTGERKETVWDNRQKGGRWWTRERVSGRDRERKG